ncbi:GerMN domain-containing protein [Modestobacter italicus]|uniref:GerMN domain-containing protein n=1 Tax=Modestobacter italicus (strain DSM 44449 / CECT 9708 / BC 501) TaxID=2732864 RepID=UPI001C971CF2|nr:GerMN domain-containing protein [Modestobacter italicus]
MRRPLVLLVALVLLLAGCGVGTQDSPERLTLTEAPTARPSSPGPGTVELEVFFVRGTRLEPVSRSAPSLDAETLLEVLVAGPTRTEVLAGLRTAIAPQTPTVPTGLAERRLEVDLPRELTDVTGGNQLLTVAQLVWTLTTLPTVDEVRFTSGGVPVEVPTDAGLTGAPVDRDDYRSVAPAASSSPAAPTG